MHDKPTVVGYTVFLVGRF